MHDDTPTPKDPNRKTPTRAIEIAEEAKAEAQAARRRGADDEITAITVRERYGLLREFLASWNFRIVVAAIVIVIALFLSAWTGDLGYALRVLGGALGIDLIEDAGAAIGDAAEEVTE